MAQQPPYYYQQQFPYSQGVPAYPQPPASPWGQPANPMAAAYPYAMNPMASPAQMAALQQMLANPDAGDVADIAGPPGDKPADPYESMLMPKPQHFAAGAAAGVGFTAIMQHLLRSPDGVTGSALERVAHNVDSLPVIRQLSEASDQHIFSLVEEISKKPARDLTSRDKHILQVFNRLNPAKAEEQLAREIVRASQGQIDDQLLKGLAGKRSISAMQGEIFTTLGKEAAKESGEKLSRDVIKGLAGASTDKEARAVLEQLDNPKLLEAFSNQVKANKRLLGMNASLNSLATHMESYAGKYALTQRMLKNGTGPIGRLIATTGDNLRRVFSDAKTGFGGKKGGKSLMSRFSKMPLVGPAFIGGLVIGQSFMEASRAEKGDKVKTFFHDLFGFGLGSFFGWEIGRSVLNKTGGVVKGIAKAKNIRVINRLVPTFNKTLFKVPVLGMRVTGGILTREVAAILIFGTIFQKVGEKIAHTIFGKPKSAHPDNKPEHPMPKQNQPLQRRYNFPPGQQVQQPATAQGAAQMAARQISQPAKPDFSITPQEIMRSPAAEAYQQMEQNIINGG